ncbi:DUF4270 domain-containing protein [Bizionia arctica]|uniref:DUF4270 domain-containing protein n=1 Tax=Bizionia arctica TaxID=1495645 RepID=A0A917GD83_9FLAO|nr:DUF4270 domain-containing protein [Bizionia arctica]GGG38330.1 hypothetical protein GCM10010976_07580 [Bizionia arctica]
MKKIIRTFKFIGVLSLVVIAFVACENDYNSLESDIEGIQNFETNSDKFAVVAYNKRVNPVQTNNLPSNYIGVYSDPIYKQTINNVITQALPTSGYYSPDFGTDPVFRQAYLTIPYYSVEDGTSGDETKYKVDSIYGTAPIKLTIYRTNFFLRDYNPDSDNTAQQLYYSNNEEFGIDSNLGEKLYENFAFLPNESEQIIYEEDETGNIQEVSRIAPSLRVPLLNTNDFWKTLLFDKQGMPELSNPNNFKDYFRGLYFKSEPQDGSTEGTAIMLNFLSSAANLTVYYDNTGEDGEIVTNNKFIMNFQGNRASTITVDPITNSLLNNLNATADKVNGDQTLYLKGGDGAIAVVNLFEDPNVLADFNALYRNSNGSPSRLINEANLVFYVDQTATSVMTGQIQYPNRVILYDLKNNIPIVDYFYDGTTNTTDPVDSKTYYSTKLDFEPGTNGQGIKYKIRLTEHLNNILLKDSTNYELGLYLTTNVNQISNSYVLDDGDLDGIPIGTVLSQKGTVLQGSNLNVPEDKRIQLEIYYTQPDN